MHPLQLVSVELRSDRIIALLAWLVLQIVDLKEFQCCLVPTIDEYSEL